MYREFAHGHTSRVSEIKRPSDKNFDDAYYDNDIVVLVLETPVQETGSNGDINGICLDHDNKKTFTSSSNCYISGYGHTQEGTA